MDKYRKGAVNAKERVAIAIGLMEAAGTTEAEILICVGVSNPSFSSDSLRGTTTAGTTTAATTAGSVAMSALSSGRR
ncbi:hypothetical protein HK100_008270 [Physocladia obscura]|uniref:Uncharacterized protein n=1 Tax=Physocladia obscura TaxID=109957 RepID=A0AAD5T9D6_9FUNG|nr:hypothetical protein HK100_008270 [Physocladia obscura]